jgi:lysophospholipase L1-like esterase
LSVEGMMPDLLHPNAEAYRALADELSPVIDELLRDDTSLR